MLIIAAPLPKEVWNKKEIFLESVKSLQLGWFQMNGPTATTILKSAISPWPWSKGQKCPALTHHILKVSQLQQPAC